MNEVCLGQQGQKTSHKDSEQPWKKGHDMRNWELPTLNIPFQNPLEGLGAVAGSPRATYRTLPSIDSLR